MGDKSEPAELESAELGPGGGKIIFENERVRVWDIELDPGQRSNLHRHTLDYMLIQLEGDRIAAEPHPETKGKYDQYEEVDVHPGDFLFIDKGGTETAVNVGKKRWREICIELK